MIVKQTLPSDSPRGTIPIDAHLSEDVDGLGGRKMVTTEEDVQVIDDITAFERDVMHAYRPYIYISTTAVALFRFL